ncbi:NYN domain-containing protein [Lyngbya sp. CCAP 1446/10]|uniref:NYN domain-containing protein n=1 Tax=Lyngbya sp. CCAP 1446/10 TaxID=439293 RepID=UPI002238A709|nr:NYN domain-containing protein [Lyngbya sp. CCAP 1446/10]MCW6051996.1 NYN domain-containing protein [Lyngbya sp. CCAP 1446/10]
MTDNHRTTSQQKSQSQRVAMLWDGQNVYLKQKEAELLVDFAKSKGRLDCQNFYYNSQYENQVNDKNRAEKLGFKGIDVPDGKNSADKQLVFDCIKRVAIKPSPDIVILVSGDRDFAGLIAVLMALGKTVIVFARRESKTVIVFARRESARKKLIKLVGEDNFHYVDELSSLCAGWKPNLKIRNSYQ